MNYFNEYQYRDLLIRKSDPYANAKYGIILSRLKKEKGLKILNVGCGSGEFSYILAAAGHKVTGIDPSKEYIDLAIKNLPPDLREKCSFNVSGIGEMSDAPSFDCVVATDVLEHIEDDEAALKKMGSLLYSDGRLIITVPAGKWLFGYHDENLGHFRRYGMGGLRRLIKNAETFNIEDLRYFGFTLVPVCFLYSKILRKPYPLASLKNGFRLGKIILSAFLFFEKIIRAPFGTSLILSAKKYGPTPKI